MAQLLTEMTLQEILAQEGKLTLAQAKSILSKAKDLHELARIVEKTSAGITGPREGANHIYALFSGNEVMDSLGEAYAQNKNLIALGNDTTVGKLLGSNEFIEIQEKLMAEAGISEDNYNYLSAGKDNKGNRVVGLDANGKSLGVLLPDGTYPEPYLDIDSRNYVLEAPAGAEFKLFVSDVTPSTT